MTKITWHTLTPEKALSRLDTSISGLSTEEANSRVSEYGPNELPGKKRVTLFKIILHQFLSPLIYILLAAGIVSIILKEYSDAIFILIVLLINAIIGAFQEWKAESKASALQEMIKLKANVKRDNQVSVINSEEIVPGDIVLLESGKKVPADLRLIIENNLTVEEAILTGESVAVSKAGAPLEEGDLPVSEQANMLFAGTTITTGRATGVVVATGLNTEIGKIATSLEELKTGKAPLVQRMERFTKKISLVILSACLVLGAIGYMSGISLKEVFFFIVAVAVSAIPEGLPIAMTVALSIGASRMAKRNVIIRRLTAVEGLGSCTYIATDKTGTITVDQQTARYVVTAGVKAFETTGEGYKGEGVVLGPNESKVQYGTDEELDQIIKAIVICNEGYVDKEDHSWSYAGDPIDVALLCLAWKLKIAPAQILGDIEKVSEQPFESERQYAMVYFKKNNELHVAIKGAMERIMEKVNGGENRELLEQANKYAENGYRIIAVGGGKVDEILPVGEVPRVDLFGFIALIDPLRPEAQPAVEACHHAGVEVAMITGDHPETSLAIAKDVGIAQNREELITGSELEEMTSGDQQDLDRAIMSRHVFSRVSPQQKQIIVQHLRESGHFIAVTGDGVNDAPALKTANIGVAMGYGTDVAKDTASIIISDNNFASIAAGIEEGRFTYSNLRKIIYLLVSTGAAELIMIGLSLAFRLPLPFLPVQLLWLNLVTNGIQDVSLAFEAGEKKVMHDPPRKPDETVFDRLMVKQTLISAGVMSLLTFGLWYYLLNDLHWNETEARNTILLLMVLLQNFHVLNCRSERTSVFRIPIKNNYFLVAGILTAQGIHILSMQLPFMQEVLSISPVPMNNWVKLLLTASVILVVMEVFKYFRFRRK